MVNISLHSSSVRRDWMKVWMSKDSSYDQNKFKRSLKYFICQKKHLINIWHNKVNIMWTRAGFGLWSLLFILILDLSVLLFYCVNKSLIFAYDQICFVNLCLEAIKPSIKTGTVSLSSCDHRQSPIPESSFVAAQF